MTHLRPCYCYRHHGKRSAGRFHSRCGRGQGGVQDRRQPRQADARRRQAAAAGAAVHEGPKHGRGVREARHRERLAARVAGEAQEGRRPRRRGAPQLPAAAAAAGGANGRRPRPQYTGGSGTGSSALSFTRKALSSMARRISGTATALFSTDEDATKLESAVEALEKESENLEEFIGLLRLEVSPRLKRRRGHVTWYGGVLELHDTRGEWGLQEVTVLVGRLEEALAKISTAVHTAEIRDVEGMELEWLAQWVVFLREARQQGGTVLHALRAELSKENPEHDREEHQLRSFVLTIESIAGDLKFFNRLITTFCVIFQLFPLTGEVGEVGGGTTSSLGSLVPKFQCLMYTNIKL